MAYRLARTASMSGSGCPSERTRIARPSRPRGCRKGGEGSDADRRPRRRSCHARSLSRSRDTRHSNSSLAAIVACHHATTASCLWRKSCQLDCSPSYALASFKALAPARLGAMGIISSMRPSIIDYALPEIARGFLFGRAGAPPCSPIGWTVARNSTRHVHARPGQHVAAAFLDGRPQRLQNRIVRRLEPRRRLTLNRQGNLPALG